MFSFFRWFYLFNIGFEWPIGKCISKKDQSTYWNRVWRHDWEEILWEEIYFSSVDAQTAATLLNRMSLRAKVLDSDTLRVDIPVTRADILHFCDIAEDCAVAYGFNNILKTVPKTSCIGNQVRWTKIKIFFWLEFFSLNLIEYRILFGIPLLKLVLSKH